MKQFLKRHGDATLGFMFVVPFVAWAIWIAPPFQLPFREIGIAVAAIATAYAAVFAGGWLKERKSKILRWIGSACLAIGLLIFAGLLLVIIYFIIWAKFNAPSLDCMQCD